jgi:putative CocE/NonD family hydrolase
MSIFRRIRPLVALSLALAIGAWPESSSAQQREVIEYPMVVRYNLKIPMRDGVHLSVDVFRPRDESKHPAVFELTPYNNDGERVMANAWHFVKRGYAFVTADARGRYDSEGTFVPYRHDGTDGSDIMTWVTQQPWSNGTIATMGGSYLGRDQWQMAKEHNPAHRAIVSYVSPADDFNDGSRFNGVPKLDLMFTWMMGMDGRVNQSRTGWNWSEVMRRLPLNTLGQVAGRDVAFWRDVMEHDRLDDFWTPLQMTGFYDTFDIPSFDVTGWYEGQLKGQVQNYVNAVKHSKSPDEHMLVIGPWLHGVNRNRMVGERDGGPQAIIDLDRLRDAWLDARMLGAPKSDLPNVVYFLPVKNEWRKAAAWPIPGTQFTTFYLDSRGKANTLLGDGVLQTAPGAGPADRYRYDPNDPVPSFTSRTAGARGGLPQGAVDHRALETRADVLVYTGQPLPTATEITGPVKATIYFAADVLDTDIAVKLMDVAPDGRSLNIAEGIARAKYRKSYAQPAPLVPGEVTGLEVELFPTSTWFEAGHRIRIEVTSSDFPNFGRNLNTMNSDSGTEIKVAQIRVEHTTKFPSHIVVPIVPAGASTRWNP